MDLELRNLTAGYSSARGKVEIHKSLTASLRRGEFTCLLGPNGAGKTTLLRTLAGFLPPLAGEILIDGRRLADISKNDLARLVSIVLTDRPALSSMTVGELVALGRSPYTGFWGKLTSDDLDIVEKSLADTGATSLRDRIVDTLSDGEMQKVMISKALAQQTPIILLDEPTAFLDFPSKAEMMRMLRDLAHSQQKIIFLSTHDLNMALALADNLWLVDRSKGVSAGTPRQLADNGRLPEYFQTPGIIFDRENLMFRL